MPSCDWTLTELTRRVADALASDEAPANGQVRAVPDERSIRYYTTLGLIDRPQLRGRTALYGARHLAQVVAVKRLQVAGRTLAEIQQTLPTLDDAALAELSGVALERRRRAAPRADFWRTEPAEAAAPAPEPAPTAPDAPAFVSQLSITLAPGVTLTLAGQRAPNLADADAVRAAAAPLLAELVRRHLIAVTLEEPDAAAPDHDRP